MADMLIERQENGASNSQDSSSGLTVWLTGFSGAGKSTICEVLAPELRARGYSVMVLDADLIRKTISRDLGFNKADRDENIARMSYLAKAFVNSGFVVLVAAISPYRQARLAARDHIGRFLEVYVDAPLSTCMERDPKHLYARALSGTIRNLTGLDDPYEAPENPDVHCRTEQETCMQSAMKVLAAITAAQVRGFPRTAKSTTS